MKKVLITSEVFSGEVNLLYGNDNELLFMDLRDNDMDEVQRAHFIRYIPATFKNAKALHLAIGGDEVEVAELPFKVSFLQWYNTYGIARNKKRCLKLWEKLSENDRALAFLKHRLYQRHLQLNTWKQKMEPDTYLRNRAWENDYLN